MEINLLGWQLWSTAYKYWKMIRHVIINDARFCNKIKVVAKYIIYK